MNALAQGTSRWSNQCLWIEPSTFGLRDRCWVIATPYLCVRIRMLILVKRFSRRCIVGYIYITEKHIFYYLREVASELRQLLNSKFLRKKARSTKIKDTTFETPDIMQSYRWLIYSIISAVEVSGGKLADHWCTQCGAWAEESNAKNCDSSEVEEQRVIINVMRRDS